MEEGGRGGRRKGEGEEEGRGGRRKRRKEEGGRGRSRDGGEVQDVKWGSIEVQVQVGQSECTPYREEGRKADESAWREDLDGAGR